MNNKKPTHYCCFLKSNLETSFSRAYFMKRFVKHFAILEDNLKKINLPEVEPANTTSMYYNLFFEQASFRRWFAEQFTFAS